MKKKAAAHYAGGICQRTLDRWCKRGLRSHKVGGVRLFCTDDIDEFISSRVEKSDADRIAEEVLNDF